MRIAEDLYYYENVLDESFCHELFNESLIKFNNGEACWSSNYFWNGPLTKDTHPIFIRDYEGEQKQKILKQLYEKNLIEDINKEYSVMNYVATRLSYIPWHNDIPYNEGITIYLNEYWEPDWGGMYLYMEDVNTNKISGFIPKFNTAIHNTKKEGNGIFHGVSLISLGSQCPRVSIQVFPLLK